MAFKPNYNQQRSERNRAKEERKQEKLARRQEESERRKAAGLAPEAGDETAGDNAADSKE
ncbi:hypothetical protein [Ferrovibrio sp.]|uniref:hypothetical protein n=1 Tax=Ferrovibrio sp. TaxID=1917215 RepID=UPI0025C14AB7|nr:hypothetical protein [Ferrovibrio sp.]MBX3455958.1 hypothetical protein [Ferrovibrio sp.]